MKNLSKEQREAILKLGNPESTVEAISIETLEQLIGLGYVYKRGSDGHLDFTELGESVYDQLKQQEES